MKNIAVWRLKVLGVFLLKLLISIGLSVLAFFVIKHQSSAAFEWAIFLILAALFHGAFWGEIKKPVDEGVENG